MRKIIEASTDSKVNRQDIKNEKDAKKERNTKALAGLAALTLLSNTSKNRDRRKLLNDIMYYLRKLINLAKQVQSLSEGTVDPNTDEDLVHKFNDLKAEIDELEGFIEEKP